MKLMKTEARYDVVLEMDYPGGESSEMAYETWGRDTRQLARKILKGYPGVQWCRVVRTGRTLRVSYRGDSLAQSGRIMTFLLFALAGKTPSDVTVRFHECQPLCIEREQGVNDAERRNAETACGV